jgi:hypothetical protein
VVFQHRLGRPRPTHLHLFCWMALWIFRFDSSHFNIPLRTNLSGLYHNQSFLSNAWERERRYKKCDSS